MDVNVCVIGRSGVVPSIFFCVLPFLITAMYLKASFKLPCEDSSSSRF